MPGYLKTYIIDRKTNICQSVSNTGTGTLHIQYELTMKLSLRQGGLNRLRTGATKLPKLSRKRRAFQETCLSFHHETVRIIYSHKCYKTNFQIHNGYFLFRVTLKHHLDYLNTIKGQLFGLYPFDPVQFNLITVTNVQQLGNY